MPCPESQRRTGERKTPPTQPICGGPGDRQRRCAVEPLAGLGATEDLVVQLLEFAQCVFFGDIRRPAISVCDGGVESLMCLCEPVRALVVEVRQSALLEFVGVLVAGDGALRVVASRFVYPLNPFGRVEPSVAFGDELFGCVGDGGGARIGRVDSRA